MHDFANRGLELLLTSPARFVAALVSIVLLLTIPGLVPARGADAAAPGGGEKEEEEVEIQELREQLTEREDENQVEDPTVIQVGGRPLSILGEYEIALDYRDRLALGDTTNRAGRLTLEQQVELELFYPLHRTLSLFVQGALIEEEDLDEETPDDVSDLYVERGEMWVYWEEVAGLPLSLEAGRLDFEDDRLWWWDEDLDAVRAIYETETYEVAVAAAQELAPGRLDESHVDPEQDDVFRVITEITWDFSENHGVELFVLSHDDRSRTHRPGETVRLRREDESDAELLWVGFRASGACDLEDRGVLGYWLDAGTVHGDEQLVSTDGGDEEEDPSSSAAADSAEASEDEEDTGEPEVVLPPGQAVIGEVTSPDVEGWGFDVGATWLLPVTSDPRITFAYARGSGDGQPDNNTDSSYRQSGLQGNEPGFGGVQRFEGYGEILDPELSNLSVFTFGIGCSLLEWNSVDVVFHDYRLVERADSLRDSGLDAELTGTSRDLGQGVDIVLALEQWERVELEFIASAFRAGRAFGRDEGEWTCGGSVAFRYAF